MSDASSHGPLSGHRVIELGSTIAAPFCGRLLADFGAEVIKVEPAEGDPVRSMGRRQEGKSLYAANIFRNKRLISVDLRKPEGQEVVRKLATGADILIENFRPGRLEEWGLGYEALSAVNPGLVLVRISGYGQTGPYRSRLGYGVTAEAVSGLREITGDPDRPPPRVAVSLTDYITGLYGAFGAMMALHDRHRTGRGQVVDAALYEGAFSFMEPHIPAYSVLGAVAKRAGSRLPNHTPNNLYPTAAGGYIHIAAANQGTFRRFTTLMGAPALADDARFATGIERSRNEDALDAIIAEWTSRQDLMELEKQLVDAEIPAARIYSVADIFADPHFRARDMLVEVPDADFGPVTLPGIVPKLSETPGQVRWAGRKIGEDTRDVLTDVAGLSEEEIARLEAAGVIQGG
jgi:crotonobetainyl-CoA:carnitine CoA-transferase CaiB-like acyl-CoA transferase